MYQEENALTILYGNSYTPLDLVAKSPDEANIWIAGLNYLISNRDADSTSARRAQLTIAILRTNANMPSRSLSCRGWGRPQQWTKEDSARQISFFSSGYSITHS